MQSRLCWSLTSFFLLLIAWGRNLFASLLSAPDLALLENIRELYLPYVHEHYFR